MNAPEPITLKDLEELAEYAYRAGKAQMRVSYERALAGKPAPFEVRDASRIAEADMRTCLALLGRKLGKV